MGRGEAVRVGREYNSRMPTHPWWISRDPKDNSTGKKMLSPINLNNRFSNCVYQAHGILGFICSIMQVGEEEVQMTFLESDRESHRSQFRNVEMSAAVLFLI